MACVREAEEMRLMVDVIESVRGGTERRRGEAQIRKTQTGIDSETKKAGYCHT